MSVQGCVHILRDRPDRSLQLQSIIYAHILDQEKTMNKNQRRHTLYYKISCQNLTFDLFYYNGGKHEHQCEILLLKWGWGCEHEHQRENGTKMMSLKIVPTAPLRPPPRSWLQWPVNSAMLQDRGHKP